MNPMKIRWFLILAALWTVLVPSLRAGEPVCVVTHYGGENGLNLRHANQILQDSTGFIWISAWNGLFRYDGQSFVDFHSQQDDSYEMAGEAIRTMWCIGHRIFCRLDGGNAVFDTRECVFRDVTPDETEFIPENPERFYQGHAAHPGEEIVYTDLFGQQWRITDEGEIYYLDSAVWKHFSYRISSPSLRRWMEDRQGNLWILGSDDSVWKMSFVIRPFSRIAVADNSHVRDISPDSRNRMWISLLNGKRVLITDSHFNKIGWLASDGTIQLEEQSFGASVFKIFHASDTVVWLGCRAEGLYRIMNHRDGTVQVAHVDDLPNKTVYDIQADAAGRLWIATYGGGVVCIPNPTDAHPRVLTMGDGLGVKVSGMLRVRNIHIVRNMLFAATGSGLLIAQIPENDPDEIEWHLHGRDPRRASSLSANATTDVTFDGYNTVYIGTETGGVNMLDIRQNLLADSLSFKHIGRDDGLGSDVCVSLHYDDIYLYIIGNTSVMRYNALAKEVTNYDSRFLHDNLIFSEVHPVHADNDTWVIGLEDGLMQVETRSFGEYQYNPGIVWSSISMAGGEEPYYAVNGLQQLILPPDKRTFTLRFAALDFVNSSAIDYSFKFVGKGAGNHWMYLHGNNSITMMDMRPGTYYLEVHSTNSNGVWVPNTRMLRIVVPEKFTESALANVLILVVAVGIAIGLTRFFTLRYVRRKERRRCRQSEA